MAIVNHDPYTSALLDGLKSEGLKEGSFLDKAYEVCHYNKKEVLPTALASILGHVGEAGINKYFSPASISINKQGESIFANDESPLDISNYLKGVQEDIDRLGALYKNHSDDSSYKFSLFHLLYTSASRIGYIKNSEHSDASLFDRNRVLAAVTTCLSHIKGGAQFLLVKGAVSGIQTFIYDNIKAEQVNQADNSAKRLRGRSFMVALFNRVLAEYLIQEFELEQANILFIGGGHFNLLLPNTKTVVERLQSLKKEINLQIIQKIGLQLGMNIAFVECGSDMGENFSDYYKEVHLALEREKQRKHQQYLKEIYHTSPRESFNEDILIGKQAPYAEYLLEIEGEESFITSLANDWKSENKLSPPITAFAFLNRIFYTIRKEYVKSIPGLFSNLEQFLKGKQQVKIKLIALNNTSFLDLANDLKALDLDIAYGVQFVGNFAPTKKYEDKRYKREEEDVMLFEDLAELNETGKQELGYSQLGVMRLDVDDLGAIFARGLGPNASIERIACMSREFQLFFGGFFNKLAEDHFLYITYSGGDDAFVIGSWLNIIHFAEQLEKKFRLFTCNNKYVSFSAGIFLCNPHYPIPRLAEDAKELEEGVAKKYGVSETTVGKNAIALYNHVLPWDRFQRAMDFAKKLDKVVPRQGETLPGQNLRRSMLQRLLRILQTSKGDLYEFYRNAGRLHGLMARHGHTYRKLYGSKEKLDTASEIVTELLQEYRNKELFEDYLISLNYIISKTRVVNQNQI